MIGNTDCTKLRMQFALLLSLWDALLCFIGQILEKLAWFLVRIKSYGCSGLRSYSLKLCISVHVKALTGLLYVFQLCLIMKIKGGMKR